MFKLATSRYLTWIIVSGVNTPVKQFRVNKRLLVVVACVAALAFLSALTLGIVQSFRIQHLQKNHQLAEAKKAQLDLQYQIDEQNKLLEAMSEKSVQMQSQLSQVETWKQQLQDILKKLKTEKISIKMTDVNVQASHESSENIPQSQETFTHQVSSAATSQKNTKWQKVSSQLQAIEDSWDQLSQQIPILLSNCDNQIVKYAHMPTLWPTDCQKINSRFGIRSDPFYKKTAFHAGLDIDGQIGDPVYAAATGVIKDVGYDKKKGNYVVINHQNGLTTHYFHLSKNISKKGDAIAKGQVIAKLGSTGRSTGAHLHFEVRKNNQHQNPELFLQQID